MQLAYDPQTSTLYDAGTGAAVAVLYDDLPAAQRHPLGHAMAAAEGIIAAARDAVAVIDPKVWTRVEWFHLADVLRAAEPPQ